MAAAETMENMESENGKTGKKKGFIIFMGLNMWVEILLMIVLTFILIAVIDAISGYRIGFLSILGIK